MGKVFTGIRLKNGEFKKDKKGKYIQKEIEEPTSLYKEDVLKIIGQDNWKKFSKWMTGQGAPIMSDGTMGYFAWDVDKFKRHYIDGVPPLTLEEVGEIVMNGTLHGEKLKNVVKKRKGIKQKCTLKRTKLRWNKKKGIRELSKKGSKDKLCWDD